MQHLLICFDRRAFEARMGRRGGELDPFKPLSHHLRKSSVPLLLATRCWLIVRCLICLPAVHQAYPVWLLILNVLSHLTLVCQITQEGS